ncbi:putative serine/threonine-protein kinase pbl3 [Orobanche minor]
MVCVRENNYGEMIEVIMSRAYDNWERLIGAVVKREELRRLALCESFSSSNSADFSFTSSIKDVAFWVFTPPAGPSSWSNSIYCDVEPMEFEEIKKAIIKYRPVEYGGFGEVFKGWIDKHTLTASKPGFGMAVAVKWNHGGLQDHHGWLKEIMYLCQLHHPNLVKFVGYCLEEDNMISVYEYMPKGSLENYLFRRRETSLSWETRIKVATGVAKGLSFLHDREIPVIHRDIKTANIFLDGDFNAKLSNFALARDLPSGTTSVSTQVMGTHGYVAPEYVATGSLTTKCDVYGFGVVLLELLTGRRAIDLNRPVNEQYLVDWVKPYVGNRRKVLGIMDRRLEGDYPHQGAYELVKLASDCLNSDEKLRPRMDEVAVALQQLSC